MLGRGSCRGCVVFTLASLTSFGFAPGCRKTAELLDPNQGSPCALSAEPDGPRPVGSALPRVGITWIDPRGLKRVPPTSPKRRASYVVPRAAGDKEDGDLAVFHSRLERRSDIDATIDCWVMQFSGTDAADVKRSEREANGLHLYTVEIKHGIFDARQTPTDSSAPKKDYALEGAIVQGPGGAYLFELIGPAYTVAVDRSAFMTLLDSMRIVRADH